MEDQGRICILIPKGEENTFKGKKHSVYTPTTSWLSKEINSILDKCFTEKQRENISNAKVLITIYGNWSGEIEYMDFLFLKK